MRWRSGVMASLLEQWMECPVGHLHPAPGGLLANPLWFGIR
jgi:hypothetical protein